MRRTKIVGLCLVAVFATSGVVASNASAKKKLPPPKPPCFYIPPWIPGSPCGPPIFELLVESPDLTFVTPAGNIECPDSSLKGELSKNYASVIKAEEFYPGTLSGEVCPTTTPLGPAEVTAANQGWSMKFTSMGAFTMKGKPKIAFNMHFEEGKVGCGYIASKVAGSFNTDENPVTITTTPQALKLLEGGSPSCPKTATLTSTWSLTSGGNPVAYHP